MISKQALKSSTPMMATALFALVLTGSIVPVATADDKELKGDIKTLQGTWVSETGPDSQWIFEETDLKATVNGNFYQCKVTLDEKAKPFGEINLKIVGGPAEGLGKLSKGIYKIEGKIVKLCIGVPGEDARPTEFETEDGKCYSFELKRKD